MVEPRPSVTIFIALCFSAWWWLKKCQNSKFTLGDFSGQKTDEIIAFFKKLELPFNDITFIIPVQLLISRRFWLCVRRFYLWMR